MNDYGVSRREATVRATSEFPFRKVNATISFSTKDGPKDGPRTVVD
jgi:hypothetical protein